MTPIKKTLPLLLISCAIATIVFLKNAWVTEDAYIVFRSLEQLFAGNGPTWNLHERVQVYTSPLWYWMLAITRIFSSNMYLNVIVISLILWLLTIFTLKEIFKNNSTLLIATLLLSASTGFFDYTSSGLENVLAYFILAMYIFNYVELHNQLDPKRDRSAFHIRAALCLFGLIICIRHDLGLLLLPATVYIVSKNSKTLTRPQWLTLSIIALSPFMLFTIFSLIYYGFPFPNTAYAKLNTGISKIELFAQGFNYFKSSIQYDTITLLIIIGGLASCLIKTSAKHTHFLAYGIILNLCYIAYIGGDFMQGRFLSYAYMCCVILLLLNFEKFKFQNSNLLVPALIILYLFFYPHTPFNSSLNYNQRSIKSGIADERGFYFTKLSLYRYLFPEHATAIFPDHQWAQNGLEFKQSHHKMTIDTYIGIFGYYAGVDKIIIDPLALSDPLLARIPVSANWRIGHFQRDIPDGYINSLSKNEALIIDPKLNEFYKKLKIVTQSKPLFTAERLKTILLFNIGAYDKLLPPHLSNS